MCVDSRHTDMASIFSSALLHDVDVMYYRNVCWIFPNTRANKFEYAKRLCAAECVCGMWMGNLTSIFLVERASGWFSNRLFCFRVYSSTHINNIKSLETCTNVDDGRFMDIDPFINFAWKKKNYQLKWMGKKLKGKHLEVETTLHKFTISSSSSPSPFLWRIVVSKSTRVKEYAVFGCPIIKRSSVSRRRL